jgi:hypothetical protein
MLPSSLPAWSAKLLAFCVAAASLGACATGPIARLPTTAAAVESPANGTWSGPIRCSAPGARTVDIVVDEFEIEGGRAQAYSDRYSFYGRFDGSGAGHIVGRVRQRGQDDAPFDLLVGLRQAKIIGTGTYEFAGILPGASDGPVTRRGNCSTEFTRLAERR